jgi:hypothetical protein
MEKCREEGGKRMRQRSTQQGKNQKRKKKKKKIGKRGVKDSNKVDKEKEERAGWKK